MAKKAFENGKGPAWGKRGLSTLIPVEGGPPEGIMSCVFGGNTQRST
ncbi:MAG: hypothetical protein RLZ37_2153, partial [Actinomycetota bacterium]